MKNLLGLLLTTGLVALVGLLAVSVWAAAVSPAYCLPGLVVSVPMYGRLIRATWRGIVRTAEACQASLPAPE